MRPRTTRTACGTWGGVLRLGALAAALLAAPPPPAASADGDTPLPLTGNQVVRPSGKRFVIDGKQTIPSGAVIRVEAGVQILGVNHASLDVRGGFKVHGAHDGRVKIEGVDFSPTVAPVDEVHFDECDLVGCDVAHAADAAFVGGFTMENASYAGVFSFRIESGYCRIMSVTLNAPATIEALPTKGRPPEVAVRTSTVADLTLVGSAAATVRACKLNGAFVAKGFTDLVVDSCDVNASLSFLQGPDDSFAKLQLLKCNMLSGSKIVLHRPTGPKTKMEKVRVEKFHFGRSDGPADMTDKKIADRIDDGADDPEVSVKAFWQNPQERPHVH